MGAGMWIISFWLYAFVVWPSGIQGNLVHEFESPVQSALQRVKVMNEQIVGNIISDFYSYEYDRRNYHDHIYDGGLYMYNAGNMVYIGNDDNDDDHDDDYDYIYYDVYEYFDYGTLVEYEHYYNRGDYEFLSSMGWPFTALMYINNTDGARSNYFIKVTSDTGADGDGALVYFNGSLISCGVNVTYFVTQVYNASVPTICEVYFTFAVGGESEGSVKAHKRSRDTNTMVTGISLEENPRNAWLGYMLLSRKAGMIIRESEVRESVVILADAVLGCQGNLVHEFESSVQSALQRVNVKKEQIVGNICGFYQYWYDYNNVILDGGNDMYDDGNMVSISADGEDSTRISYERYYDRGDYEFSSSLGWPFTALIYINNTDGTHSAYAIKVVSDTGADYDGALVYFNGSLISCGVNVTYFVTQVYNASDPSICEVYYTFGAGEASEGSFKADKLSSGTGDLDTEISLEGNPRNAWLGYTLLSRKEGMMIRESEVKESVKVLAGAVLGCQGAKTLTIALATAAAISVTAAMIFGILVILKMRKQRASVNIESTSVTRATSGGSSERPINEITGPISPPQESICHECAGPSSPHEANLYENSIAVQETRGL